MLARLDGELAPLRSSVNREGTFLRIEGPSGVAVVAPRVPGIVEKMGYRAEPAREPVEIERWFGAGEVDQLSGEEARVLASRWVDELEAENVVPDPKRLFEPLRAALLKAFREASLTGSVDALRIDDAIREALGEEPAAAVRNWLGRRVGLSNHD